MIANLSQDLNKLNIFLKNIDGHSMATVTYWPDLVAELLGEHIEDLAERAIKFKCLVDDGNAEAKALRDRSKAVSFGLAYGCFPPKVAQSTGMPIEEAEQLFNAYHNDMFPGITKYREEYVLRTAKRQGYIHLGLGFRMYTDNPEKDIRTINNGTCQFWSILSVLTMNKMHQLIDKEGLSGSIKTTASIYDSIYFVIEDKPEIIKWLNDNLIPVMEQDFMVDQTLPNAAELEIGPNWAELYTVPHNASLEEIQEVREEFV